MANYISVENQQALTQGYSRGVKLVLAIGLSVLIFMSIARFISPGDTLPGSEKLVRPIFIVVIVLGLIVVSLRRLLMSQSMMAKVASRGVNALLARLLTITVICLAVAFLVCIMGFTFYLLTGDYEYSWRLGVVSLLLIFYSFPRRGEWERIISRNTQ
jgi:TRAP-type C4-dicarboxylate transport system permease small subunit